MSMKSQLSKPESKSPGLEPVAQVVNASINPAYEVRSIERMPTWHDLPPVGTKLYSDSQLAALQARVLELEETVEQLKNSGLDQIMAMSDKQIEAAIRLEGSDPKDAATICRQSLEIAQLRAENEALTADVEKWRALEKREEQQ